MLILVILLYCFLEIVSGDFVFNRVRLLKNTAKQSSIRLHSASPELRDLHVILQFSSPVNTQHNTLFIDQSSVVKYSKIMQEETQKIVVLSRGNKKILSYLTLRNNASNEDVDGDGYNDRMFDLIQSIRFLGIAGASDTTYDGVFLMDAYSAIWSQYNIAILTEYLLIFRYTVNGTLSTREDTEVADYDGFTHLPCHVSFDSDRCLVTYQDFRVNNHSFPHYRIVIDFDSPQNFLPIDLYLMWQNKEEFNLFAIQLDTENWLYLNQHFQYELHQSNIILLGVDVLHHFPRVEYSVTSRTLQLWYHSEHIFHHDKHETVKILFVFFNTLLEIALFIWVTSYNYRILHYIIDFPSFARLTHFFAFKQIWCEVLVIIVTLIVMPISLFVTQSGIAYHARIKLFIGFLVYYLLLNLGLLLLYRKELFHTLKRLWAKRRCVEIECGQEILPYGELFTNLGDVKQVELLHKTVVATYHDTLIRLPTPLAIIHNLVFISNLLLTLALLFNFYTPKNNVYLLAIMLISAGIICFQVYCISIGILYLSLFQQCRLSTQDKRRNGWLIVFLVVQSVATLLYIIFSYHHIFLVYLHTINSTHSEISIEAGVKVLIGLVVLLAVFIVFTAFDKYADPLLECAIKQRRRRRNIGFIQ